MNNDIFPKNVSPIDWLHNVQSYNPLRDIEENAYYWTDPNTTQKHLVTYHLDGATHTDVTTLSIEDFIDLKRNMSMRGDFYIVYVKEI